MMHARVCLCLPTNQGITTASVLPLAHRLIIFSNYDWLTDGELRLYPIPPQLCQAVGAVVPFRRLNWMSDYACMVLLMEYGPSCHVTHATCQSSFRGCLNPGAKI
ncbi:hypothetical protein BS78_09G013300 [Paspalum vaginatum]|nr:hypothetical protein BS78_09G013300 [Paspalum vaginatum]